MKQRQKTLYERFSEIEDFRRGQGRMHDLPLILTIVTMATMSGFLGQRSKGDFIKKHGKELIKHFKIKKKRLPSYQTIARVLENIDFARLTSIFHDWAIGYVTIEEKEWISIDGKAIAGTVKNPHNQLQSYTNLVTIFASKRKQVLVVGKVANKSSEISLVKTLIQVLDLEGVVFTLDALHCQKETVKAIIATKNDYVIGVKGNQQKLEKLVKKSAKKTNP